VAEPVAYCAAMRIALIVVTALMLAVSGSAMSTPDASKPTRATLGLADTAPLKLRGRGFHARERVRVSVSAERRATKRVVATAAGSFVVTFADISVDRCNGLVAVAVGRRGSRATYKQPQPLCPPRL
jgi:hypothetical protein